MDRTGDPRPLLVDPAAPRRTPRERVAVRWFTDTPRTGPHDHDRWDAVDRSERVGLAAAA